MEKRKNKKGAGRPKIGVSRALRITLPEEEWERIDKLVEEDLVKTQSEYFRLAHFAQWDREKIEWREES